MKTIHVRAGHPAWIGINDDDWNGATFGQWLRGVRGLSVELYPPENARAGIIEDMAKSLYAAGASIVIYNGRVLT